MKRTKTFKALALSTALLATLPNTAHAQSIYSVFDDLDLFTTKLMSEQSNRNKTNVASELMVKDQIMTEVLGEPQMFLIKKLLNEQLGKPYVYGAYGPDAFDCSGLIYYVYGLAGKPVPRTSQTQGQGGQLVEKSDLKFGDLVFFDTRNTDNPKDITIDTSDTISLFSEVDLEEQPVQSQEFKPQVITHSGIYVGEGMFVHASSGNIMKVVMEKLDSKYFAQRYIYAKRY